MKIGVTGLITPETWSFDETLDRIKEAGYTAFELALRDTGFFSLNTDDGDLRTLTSRAKDAGIDLVSICPAVKSRPKNLMIADDGLRNEAIATFHEYIRIADVCGIDTILVVLGSLTPDLFYDQAYENALKSIRSLAQVAEDAGVKLAIEYVWNKFLLSPVEFARFCDDVGSPSVGFYFDPGNMAIFSYPEHWIRICSKHVMAVHMKDFKRDGFQWTPLLEGDVDFKAVMTELAAIGFDGPLVSEVGLDVASLEKTAKDIERIIEG